MVNYVPRTVKPDMVSLWPPTELSEGYYYETIRENFVISDGRRNLHVSYVHPLQHVEGMLMAHLPGEGLLFEADLANTHQDAAARATADQRSLYNAVQRLKLNVSQIVSVHGAPMPWRDFAKTQ